MATLSAPQMADNAVAATKRLRTELVKLVAKHKAVVDRHKREAAQLVIDLKAAQADAAQARRALAHRTQEVRDLKEQLVKLMAGSVPVPPTTHVVPQPKEHCHE